MKLNKWVKRLLKVVLAIALFSFAMLFYLTGGKFFAKSGISNCVIVNNEKEAVEVIEYLRDKPEVRERIALNAYKTAKKLFVFDRMISEYRKTFKRIFSK